VADEEVSTDIKVSLPPNWFIYAKPNFEAFLEDYKDRPGVEMLQIGAYTGDASLWLVKNILTGEGSTLTDVDTWEGSAGEPEHQALNWRTIWNIYFTRLKGRPVIPFRMTSDEYFEFFKPVNQFDIIYVDGGHTKEQVARDAGNAHTALKHGGLLIFDDYTWIGGVEGDRPVDAINPFYYGHQKEYEVVVVNDQVWLKKL